MEESKTKSLDSVDFWIYGIGTPVFVVLWSLYSGFCFQLIWNWFAAPFTTIRLSLPEAIGLMCLLVFLRGRSASHQKISGSEFANFMLDPLLLLGIGYIAHLYMHGAA